MYIGFYLYDPRLSGQEAFQNEVQVIVAAFVIAGALNLFAHFEYYQIAIEYQVLESDETEFEKNAVLANCETVKHVNDAWGLDVAHYANIAWTAFFVVFSTFLIQAHTA